MATERKSRAASGSDISRPQRAVALSNQDIGSLLEAQRMLADALPALDYADKCGIECKEQRAEYLKQLQDSTNLLKYFGGIEQ